MLNVKIICLGKLRESYLQDAIKEYSKRLSAYCKFEIEELPEVRFSSDHAPRAEIDSALAEEGERILAKIPPRAKVIALCVEGKEMSTEAFAETVQETMNGGDSCLCFLIGSSYGLSPAVKARADERLSFSKMTFPHTLMRLILTEQIYRAFKILHNETYHK